MMKNKQKLLLVDDEPRNLRILVEMLSDDFELETADSGADMLEKVEAFNPEVILLDVMLPDTDGFELTKKLKSDEVTNHIKVILVSGHAGQEAKDKGTNAGADSYVVKPFMENDILPIIYATLSS